MSVAAPIRNDYLNLAARFQSVRRAWKVAAALSGLAVMLTEGLGILAVLFFLDWLFQPAIAFRFCLWAAAIAGLGFIFVRHVLRPLFRRIPDEQIALYIEEKRSDLDGVLITAAEYGHERSGMESSQAALIDAILQEATIRSNKLSFRHISDFSRLRKYGIAALAGIVVFILLGLLFPGTFGSRMERVLKPWSATLDPSRESGLRPLEPLRFELSHEESTLQRGASFELEASLSRASEHSVILNFRPATEGGVWQSTPMTEIEKLNGYKGVLADINEDLEFSVSSGPDKSATHRITVFDPLVVQSIETTTHPPEYTGLPDQTENPSTGDVAALIGSDVTVRIQTNTPLKEGKITWSNGQTQALAISTATSGEFTFTVKENTGYDFSLTDINGQQMTNPVALSVRAIPDEPPSLEVKSPVSPVVTHPLGEVPFVVNAGDDFGLDSVTLIYSRLDQNGLPVETRTPLTLEPAGETGKRGTYRFMLEDAKPLFHSGEALPFHLEAKDTKGQLTKSEISLLVIGYYETWGTWAQASKTGGESHVEGPDLMTMLSLVWALDIQKNALAPTDLQSQSKEIAAKMVTDSGALRSFVNLAKMPQLAKVADQIASHAKAAHTALEAADTTTAATELSVAAALYAGNGLLEDIVLHTKSSSAGGSAFKPPSVTMLEQARLEALDQAASENTRSEQDKADSKANSAAGKKMENLVKEQDGIAKQAKDLAAGAAEGAAGANPEKSGDLATQQRNLAAKTKTVANEVKTDPSAAAPGSKLAEASRKAANAALTMEDAANDFAAGKGTEGAVKAAKAKTQLGEAAGILAETSRDKLEEAISMAEVLAIDLLEKQKTLRGATEISAKELEAGKTADQRQQRDLQKQAFRQTELRAGMESLTGVIDELATRAEQVGQAEAIRGLTEAQKTIKRNLPAAKMGNAAIELNTGSPAPAVEQQKKAEDGLTKVIANLQTSSDALAASGTAQLRRAERSAAEAKATLAMLSTGKGADGKAPGADSKAPGAAGKAPGAAGKAPGADGKAPGADGKAPGADGKAPGADGKAPGADGKAPGADGNQESGGNAQKAAVKLARLVNNLDNRDLVPQAKIDRLKELGLDKAELEKRLLVDPTTLAEVTGLVADIQAKLEAEASARSESGSLQASQREECPPIYRQFVNQYFESLSRTPQVQPPTP